MDQVTDVEYQTANTHFHGVLPVLVSAQRVRNSSLVPVTKTLRFNRPEVQRSKWEAAAGVLPHTIIRLVADSIPVRTNDGVIVASPDAPHPYFDALYPWATVASRDRHVQTDYEVIVPPMTTLEVSLEVIRGSIDVPFSYSRIDAAGEVTPFDDGTYKGTNLFGYTFSSEQKDDALDAVEVGNI